MFVFDLESGVPIYRQLIDQIKRLIAGGRLAAGDDLPSVRELASVYQINAMTISKAYQQLEAEGLLVRRRGKPMQVAESAKVAESARNMLDAHLGALVQVAEQLGVSRDELPKLMLEFIHKEV